MKKIISIFVALFVFLSSEAFALDDFPGAVGFGKEATGGRGGTVYFVTNLNDSGAGSFREAAEAQGPRIILFKVSGTIELTNNIRIRYGDVTIAGQTAPGGGICLKNRPLTIFDSNVIIRGLKVRPGDTPGGDEDNRDGIQVENNYGGGVSEVIIDHCSVTWSIDELLALWYDGTHDVTISHTIMSEALYDSIHGDGPHSMGPLFGNGSDNVTMYANLMSNNSERNPRTFAKHLEFINNLTYNRKKHGLRLVNNGSGNRTNAIGNYWKEGPSHDNTWPCIMVLDYENAANTYLYVDGNYCTASAGLYTPGANVLDNPTFTGTGITAMSSADAYSYVLANVGALPWNHDAVDSRLISQVVTNSGSIIDTVAEVGGYPALTSDAYPTDTDGDGMSDVWEINHGSNPNVYDPTGDANGDGYNNIENYINDFYIEGQSPPTGEEGGEEPPPPPPPASLRLNLGTATEGGPFVTSDGGIEIQ